MKENQTSQKPSTEWDHNLHCTFSILILPDTVGSLWQFEVQDRFYFKNSKMIQHVLFKLWNTLDIITEKNLELFWLGQYMQVKCLSCFEFSTCTGTSKQ